jgi:hypothetical protein
MKKKQTFLLHLSTYPMWHFFFEISYVALVRCNHYTALPLTFNIIISHLKEASEQMVLLILNVQRNIPNILLVRWFTNRTAELLLLSPQTELCSLLCSPISRAAPPCRLRQLCRTHRRRELPRRGRHRRRLVTGACAFLFVAARTNLFVRPLSSLLQFRNHANRKIAPPPRNNRNLLPIPWPSPDLLMRLSSVNASCRAVP